VHQHALAGLDVGGIEEPSPCGDPADGERRGLLNGQRRRPASEVPGRGNRVFGVPALAAAEDGITRGEIADTGTFQSMGLTPTA
jgi:hypothetical protein